MPAKGSGSGRVSGGRGGGGGSRGGGQTWRGAAKSAWKDLGTKNQRQIVVGTGFNVGIAGAAGVSMKGAGKAKADPKRLGAEGPKKSVPKKKRSR